jgi:hypothetical protein
MILLVHFPKLQDYPMQLVVVKNKKNGPLNLHDEPPSPSPSDSSNDNFKHDDSNEEGEDDMGNNRPSVFSKDIHNNKIKK